MLCKPGQPYTLLEQAFSDRAHHIKLFLLVVGLLVCRVTNIVSTSVVVLIRDNSYGSVTNHHCCTIIISNRTRIYIKCRSPQTNSVCTKTFGFFEIIE